MTFENYMKHRHFQTTLIKLKKPMKLKISSFYGYTEVNEEDIDNICFIDNKNITIIMTHIFKIINQWLNLNMLYNI